MPHFSTFIQPQMAKDYAELATTEENEKELLKAEHTNEEGSISLESRGNRRLTCIGAILCIIIIGLLLIDIYLRTALKNVGFNIKTPIPETPLKLVTFDATARWLEMPSPESNLRWMDEIGPSTGYIGIRNPRDYIEQPGIEGVGGENYGLSMFHSLHCLILIRQAWYEASDDKHNITYSKANLDEGYDLQAAHVAHCLDYVRQGIKCAGDLTLEWATAPGSRIINAMGGELHVCRDFEKTREFVDQNLPLPRSVII